MRLGSVVFLMLALGATAYAGVGSEDTDFLFLKPLVGSETLSVKTGSVRESVLAGQVVTETHTSTSLAIGASAGFRLGLFSVSLMFQRGLHDTAPSMGDDSAVADKLYGELGLHAWLAPTVAISPHLSLGMASLHSDSMQRSVRGPGGKAGLGFDIYPSPIFSVGTRVDFDAQTYSGNDTYSVAFGFTLAASVGLHL